MGARLYNTINTGTENVTVSVTVKSISKIEMVAASVGSKESINLKSAPHKTADAINTVYKNFGIWYSINDEVVLFLF